jgi:hypothetical protein
LSRIANTSPRMDWLCRRERHPPVTALRHKNAGFAFLAQRLPLGVHAPVSTDDLLKGSTRTLMNATTMRLNSAMQAVEIVLDIAGTSIKAVIPREVFECRLRSGTTPDAWLRSYEQNSDVIHHVIGKRLAARPQDFVVVRSSDFRSLRRPSPAPGLRQA